MSMTAIIHNPDGSIRKEFIVASKAKAQERKDDVPKGGFLRVVPTAKLNKARKDHPSWPNHLLPPNLPTEVVGRRNTETGKYTVVDDS